MFKRLFGKDPEFVVPHSDDELVKLAILKKKIGNRKVICNLTSIPPRFKYVDKIIESLKTHYIFDDIVLHVPRVYNRNFTCNSEVPSYAHMVPEDYGPGTRIMYAQGDIVVYCDDDTTYSHMTSLTLVEKFLSTNACCGTSGFNFEKYFVGDFSKKYGESVNVIEGYGMVICDKSWIDDIRKDFIELHKLTYNDDMIFSNLLEKIGVKRMVYPIHNGFVQHEYGFGIDALHYNNGETTHIENNKRILKMFRVQGKMYFKPIVSYAICVCDEARELDTLLWTLDECIIHSDEIVVLVDSTKDTNEVWDVLKKYPVTTVDSRVFDDDFAKHKNILGSMCRGKIIFNIDADEVPCASIIESMYKLIDYELVFIPRVNVIPGATTSLIQHCNFSLSKEGFINFPDYQGRIYKNGLQWEGKIHEKIQGAKNHAQIAADPMNSLWHIKTPSKMKRQDEFYQKLALKTHDETQLDIK